MRKHSSENQAHLDVVSRPGNCSEATELGDEKSSLALIAAAIAWGDMVLVVNDLDSSIGGYLLQSARAVDQASISFMAVNARGLICLVIDEAKRESLGVPFAPQRGEQRTQGRFCVSIESSLGVSTGISASDRAQTIRVAAQPDAQSSDLIQPGHVFPLVPRGPLTDHCGMAEIAVELSKGAIAPSPSVVCQVLDDDGEVASTEYLLTLSKRFDLPVVRVSDVVRKHCEARPLVRRASSIHVGTDGIQTQIIRYASLSTDEEFIVFADGSADSTQVMQLHCCRGVSCIDLLMGVGHDLSMLRDSLSRGEGNTGVLYVVQVAKARAGSNQGMHGTLVAALRCAQICLDLQVTSLSSLSHWLLPHAKEFALLGIEVLDPSSHVLPTQQAAAQLAMR